MLDNYFGLNYLANAMIWRMWYFLFWRVSQSRICLDICLDDVAQGWFKIMRLMDFVGETVASSQVGIARYSGESSSCSDMWGNTPCSSSDILRLMKWTAVDAAGYDFGGGTTRLFGPFLKARSRLQLSAHRCSHVLDMALSGSLLGWFPFWSPDLSALVECFWSRFAPS